MSDDDREDNIFDMKGQKTKVEPPKVYKNPVEVALELKKDLDDYEEHQDRKQLIGALKEQFLVSRYNNASQAEKTRYLGIQILFERMHKMSDNMLLKTIRELAEIGVIDLQSVTGMALGARGGSSLVNINQAFGLGGPPRDTLQLGASRSTETNPIKDTGNLLEALEHIAEHFKDRPMLTIENQSNSDDKK
jgi:hypothetical protein